MWFSFTLKGTIDFQVAEAEMTMEPRGKLIFIVGILSLMFVPVFKVITGLPPFMAILFSMSIVWLVTDLLHYKYDDRKHLRVVSIFPRIDLSGIFFFLGILLSVDALETAGILKAFAVWLDQTISSKVMIATIIGLISAVIDNVPLVEACMGMYDLNQYPTGSPFWELIAFSAGTGGSALIIGSTAGVAFMGMEKVDFFWYLKKATIPAVLGYFVGIAVYIAISTFWHY